MTKTLKELREERGLTQKELAKASGVKNTRIKRLENLEYSKVDVSDLYMVCKYFDTFEIKDLTVFD